MISAESADLGLNCLAFGGGLIVIQSNPATPIGNFFTKQVSINDVFLGGALGADDRAKKHLAHVGTEMLNLFQQKKFAIKMCCLKSWWGNRSGWSNRCRCRCDCWSSRCSR